MAEQQHSIRALFATAKSLSKQLEQWETTSQIYQDNLRSAISSFEECRRLADQVSLFSPNETADDISSRDLPYLSIDYHLGELIPKETTNTRKPQLQRCQEAYGRYLGLLDTYSMLSNNDRKLYERYHNSKDTFSILAGVDVSARRDKKIARYKQEQELKRKLEARNKFDLIERLNTNSLCSISPKTPTPSRTTIPLFGPSISQNCSYIPTTPSKPSIS